MFPVALQFEHEYYWFSRKLDIPAIVHAIPSEQVFKAILLNRRLLRASDRPGTGNPNMSFVDRLAGLQNGIWFAPGFSYNVDMAHYPFGIMLSIDEIDSGFEVYKLEINHFFYREIVRYWYGQEREVFDNLCKDARMKEQLETFIRTDHTEPLQNGYRAGILFPWPLASCYEEGYRMTKDKAALHRRLERAKHELSVGLFKRRYVLKQFWKADYRTKPEIIANRTVELDSPRLVGFFIAGAFQGAQRSAKQVIREFLRDAKRVDQQKVVVFDGRKKESLSVWLAE